MAHGKYPKDRTKRNVIRGTISEKEVIRVYKEQVRGKTKKEKLKMPKNLIGKYPGK